MTSKNICKYFLLCLVIPLILFVFSCRGGGIAGIETEPETTTPLCYYYTFADYEKTTHMIPMRDGVRLNTEIYKPVNAGERLPVIFYRTPYGIPPYREGGDNFILKTVFKELLRDGYIFVFQDIRGRYKSEGQFETNRPPRHLSDPAVIDECTDAYDSIQWMMDKLDGHNGRVGMIGGSYSAWAAVMALLDPHPALEAVCIQASPADFYVGDDFFHNGAFRLSYSLEYAYFVEHEKTNQYFPFGINDVYRWFLDLGPLSNLDKNYLKGQLPTWNRFMKHTDYDRFWQERSVTGYIMKTTVPTLNVAGWWDAEDFYGPLEIYRALERFDHRGINNLVVGPWSHGGWGWGSGQKLGPIDFGSKTAQHYRKNIEAPWFAYYLKGKGTGQIPEALTFCTGSNRWVKDNHWPPEQDVKTGKLFLRENGKLSFQPPIMNNDDGCVNYVSDPADPVPYTRPPIGPFIQKNAGAAAKYEDQRFLNGREDVVSWMTPPLKQDIEVAGRVMVELHAATTGTDCDWVVKLIDVYPDENLGDPAMDGYQLLIADEVIRARYRDDLRNPKRVPPGKILGYTIDLNTRRHCFLKGHRIMVQVQSSSFPLIDRNPQTFVHIPSAKKEDYRPASQTIYFSRDYSSHIKIPMICRED